MLAVYAWSTACFGSRAGAVSPSAARAACGAKIRTSAGKNPSAALRTFLEPIMFFSGMALHANVNCSSARCCSEYECEVNRRRHINYLPGRGQAARREVDLEDDDVV